MGDKNRYRYNGEDWLRRGLLSIYKEACVRKPTKKEIAKIAEIAKGCIQAISVSQLAEQAGSDYSYRIEAEISSRQIEWRMKRQEAGPPPPPPFGHSLALCKTLNM